MNLKQKLTALTSIIFCGVFLANAVQLDPKVIDTLVMGNTEFAVKLYGKLKNTEGNLFLSPYSISTVLAMTYAGAKGKPATQMAKALSFNLDQQQLHPAFAEIEHNINRTSEATGIMIWSANSLWPLEKYPFMKKYLNVIHENYKADITPVNYKKDTEKIRLQINDWVEKKTMNKIKDLIQPGHLDALTRLTLVNAIYFKGQWLYQFDKANTKDAPFWITPDTSVDVPTMYAKAKFGYDDRDSLQILELPYKGREISMFIILPYEKEGLDRIQNSLTAKKLTEWTMNTSTKEVKVYLPRFSITSEFDLPDALKALGMKNAFIKGKANFSGMDGRKNWLYISDAIHKAFVDVDEEGTEAAAASAVMMRALAVPEPPPVVNANHPFLFVIRENSKSNILFMGRVVDPSLASQ